MLQCIHERLHHSLPDAQLGGMGTADACPGLRYIGAISIETAFCSLHSYLRVSLRKCRLECRCLWLCWPSPCPCC